MVNQASLSRTETLLDQFWGKRKMQVELRFSCNIIIEVSENFYQNRNKIFSTGFVVMDILRTAGWMLKRLKTFLTVSRLPKLLGQISNCLYIFGMMLNCPDNYIALRTVFNSLGEIFGIFFWACKIPQYLLTLSYL